MSKKVKAPAPESMQDFNGNTVYVGDTIVFGEKFSSHYPARSILTHGTVDRIILYSGEPRACVNVESHEYRLASGYFALVNKDREPSLNENDTYVCPHCWNELGTEKSLRIQIRPNYCPNCGQKLKWK